MQADIFGAPAKTAVPQQNGGGGLLGSQPGAGLGHRPGLGLDPASEPEDSADDGGDEPAAAAPVAAEVLHAQQAGSWRERAALLRQQRQVS